MIVINLLLGTRRLKKFITGIDYPKYISLYSYVMDKKLSEASVSSFKGTKDAYNGVIVRSSTEPYGRQVMEQVLKGGLKENPNLEIRWSIFPSYPSRILETVDGWRR